MLNKQVGSTILKVFGMTQPGIEPTSLEQLANTGLKKLRNNYKNYSIIEIGQIIEKNPGNLRWLPVTPTPAKNK